ncbi:hypothetical protein [Chryseobacterium scophthalmum]|uniref:Uncharacterized protein n=1 Tax=Chryseobacterium scophthalmum TaxID=59733 RepID=A0A1N6EGJ8_9FLAO|nr:hypothetical protein [Chryseobacterium scophthalmum]SIN82162.1 hypothetical protein SAMN05421769_0334 [Chryseobacterium scophthalmum]
MEFKITELFKNLEIATQSDYFEEVDINSNILETNEEEANFVINKFTKLDYEQVANRYLDILNIDKFHFHSWFEIDDFASQVEFYIENLYPGLSLLDYDAKLWFKGQTPEEIALWKTFRILDTRPEIGDGKLAVYSIQNGIAPPNEPAIYYINKALAYKTNLTFNGYFEAVADMLGIADWQYLFTEVSLEDLKADGIYKNLKESLEALQKAFPDKDYSRYFKLLEER